MPKKTLIITAIIVALIAIGATATYTILRQGGEEVRRQEEVATTTEQPIVEPQPEEPVTQPEEPTTAEPIDTSDWKTYRSEEYGFVLNYPRDWNIKEHLYNLREIKLVSPSTPASYLYVIENENPDGLTLDEWYKRATVVGGRPTVKAGARAGIVNGYSAYIVEVGELEPPSPFFEIFIANYQHRIFTLYSYRGNKEDSDVLNKILSTFRFVAGKPSG